MIKSTCTLRCASAILDRVTDDPVVERTLEHLSQRRDQLKASIAEHRKSADAKAKELAKIEQALAGLRPLGHQNLLEKAGPVLLTTGLIAMAALGAVQAGVTDSLPPTTELLTGVLYEGGRMKDDEMLDRMKALGWQSESQDELALIRSYLSRLVQRGTIIRVEPSTYELALSDAQANK